MNFLGKKKYDQKKSKTIPLEQINYDSNEVQNRLNEKNKKKKLIKIGNNTVVAALILFAVCLFVVFLNYDGKFEFQINRIDEMKNLLLNDFNNINIRFMQKYEMICNNLKNIRMEQTISCSLKGIDIFFKKISLNLGIVVTGVQEVVVKFRYNNTTCIKSIKELYDCLKYNFVPVYNNLEKLIWDTYEKYEMIRNGEWNLLYVVKERMEFIRK